jgi:hypothetical protein
MTGRVMVDSLRNDNNRCGLGRLAALNGRFALRRRSARTISSNRFSKTCLRATTVHMDTQMELPKMMRRNSNICCHVVI